MGRCIYEGIYDPQSPHADERGLRRDVLAALRELNFRIIRYPGGNFLSGYRWLDGVGPRGKRPVRRDLAWRSVETNQFGTDEFMEFCHLLDTQPMLAANLGTGTIAEAANLVELLQWYARLLLRRPARCQRPSRAVRRAVLVPGQ